MRAHQERLVTVVAGVIGTYLAANDVAALAG
jgi:hypothetical protein